jgi:hypothetical protein
LAVLAPLVELPGFQQVLVAMLVVSESALEASLERLA